MTCHLRIREVECVAIAMRYRLVNNGVWRATTIWRCPVCKLCFILHVRSQKFDFFIQYIAFYCGLEMWSFCFSHVCWVLFSINAIYGNASTISYCWRHFAVGAGPYTWFSHCTPSTAALLSKSVDTYEHEQTDGSVASGARCFRTAADYQQFSHRYFIEITSK